MKKSVKIIVTLVVIAFGYFLLVLTNRMFPGGDPIARSLAFAALMLVMLVPLTRYPKK